MASYATGCGQSYCKDRISKVKKEVFPHCHETLEVFPDKKSVRLINQLEIKCPYHIEGKCQWKGSKIIWKTVTSNQLLIFLAVVSNLKEKSRNAYQIFL